MLCSAEAALCRDLNRQEEAASPLRVQFTLISTRLSPRMMVELIGQSSKFAFEFSSATEFSARDWYQASTDGEFDLRVWLVLRHPETTQLFFADPAEDRFLIRSLRLTDALDEMDRETLAQAIKWSLSALSQGSVDAMTRDQASSLAVDESVNGTRLVSDQVTRRASPRPERTPASARQDAIFRGSGPGIDLATGYRMSLFAAAIPLVHGPFLRLGLDYGWARTRAGFSVTGTYFFPTSYSQGPLTLQLDDFSVRGDARVLFVQGADQWALGPALGGGIDLIGLRPRSTDPLLIASDQTNLLVGYLTAGIAAQIRITSLLRFDLEAGVDVGLDRVPLFVVTEAGSEPYLTVMPVRPSFRCGFSFF